MKRQYLFNLATCIIIFAIALSACQAAASPSPTTAPTTPPTAVPPTTAPTTGAATTAPTTPPQPTTPSWTPLTLAAPDCSNGNLKSIAAPDANTFVFTTCKPAPAVPAQFAFSVMEILPKALLDKTGGDSAKIGEAPIGTGPYILKEWVKGDHMTFVPNPLWWGGTQTIKTLIFRWSAEPAQRLLELQSGNVDAMEIVGADDFKTVSNDKTLSFIPVAVPNILYIGMNVDKKPFDNEKVRQAFAMAIDRQRIVKNFFPEGSTVADQFTYPGLTPGYTNGMTWYDYNPTLAKQMLTEAGFDFNQTIPYQFRTPARVYVPNQQQVAQDVQAQLAQIGVKVKLEVQESGTFIGNSGLGNLTFFQLGWGEDYPDATDWFDYHFSSTTKTFGTPFPDIAAQITAAATTGDPAARQKAYDTVNQLLKQHVPMIPVAHNTTADAAKATVKNVVIGPYNQNFPFMQTDSGQLVWLQTGEPISLWCGDETDGETINACMMLYEPLLKYKYGTTQYEPALATGFDVNADGTVYTFHLRQGVKWSDGTAFTSADVFATIAAMWDAKNPNHKGNTGVFEYFSGWFGVLNPPPKPTATP